MDYSDNDFISNTEGIICDTEYIAPYSQMGYLDKMEALKIHQEIKDYVTNFLVMNTNKSKISDEELYSLIYLTYVEKMIEFDPYELAAKMKVKMGGRITQMISGTSGDDNVLSNYRNRKDIMLVSARFFIPNIIIKISEEIDTDVKILSQACMNLCMRLEQYDIFKENNPKNMAAAVVYFFISESKIKMTKKKFSEICDVGVTVLSNCLKEIQKLLK